MESPVREQIAVGGDAVVEPARGQAQLVGDGGDVTGNVDSLGRLDTASASAVDRSTMPSSTSAEPPATTISARVLSRPPRAANARRKSFRCMVQCIVISIKGKQRLLALGTGRRR